MNAIIVHCGAGGKRNLRERKAVVIDAAEVGYTMLKRGASAVDAAVQATIILEDSPVSNAGIGSGLNLEGEVEMDASIMTDDLRCGAVACIKNVRNPIIVARYVMDNTDHIILAADGAQRFAGIMGVEPHDPVTERSRKLYQSMMKKVRKGKGTRYFPRLPGYLKHYHTDTVGAVALDNTGGIAVTNSTAGIVLKMPGRIGDTPVFGAGLYAESGIGVSATGHGEGIVRLCLSKVAVDYMKKHSAQRSVALALRKAKRHRVRCGLIAIDRKGRFGYGFTSDAMPCASIKDGTLVYQE
jgi:beta-aspartyl-peptidase (threonine type)